MKMIYVAGVMFALIGCMQDEPIKEQVVIMNGMKYTLVQKGQTNSDGTVTVDLYVKEGETRVYYTPSLSGRDMISIAK